MGKKENKSNATLWAAVITGVFALLTTIVTVVVGPIIQARLDNATATPSQPGLTPSDWDATQTPSITPAPLPATPTLQAGMAYRALVSQDSAGFVPDLATSWDVSDDGLTWTFSLNTSVSLPNGRSFEANAVKQKLADWPPVRLGYIQVDVINASTVSLKQLVPVDGYNLLDELSKVKFEVVR
jgi:ABC-type transport system substrate-binding protein